MIPAINLRVRYLPASGDLCGVFGENLIEHRDLEWPLPTTETALVAVDAWNCHYLDSYQRRAAEICRQKIKPVMDACRKVGIAVIHAPTAEDAKRYPCWTQYAGDEELNFGANQAIPDWPPQDFLRRQGNYQQFAKPIGAAFDVWNNMKKDRQICADVAPQSGDYVIATGKQLRRLCRHKRILHLLYVGFAANWCVLFRDYGIRDMVLAGYNIVLLRDCTTAVENAYSMESKSMTEWAILEAEEVFGAATATSEDFINACKELK